MLRSKFALLNQARLDCRDPRFGLTQRLGACMHGVGAQDQVVIMRHSRAEDELCVGLGLEFDHDGRWLIGPRLVDVDLSLVKNIRIPRISEAFNLQLRVEAFNIFNRANFQAPTHNTTFGGRLGFNQESLGTAGLLDSTATPSRQVQFGAKVIF